MCGWVIADNLAAVQLLGRPIGLATAALKQKNLHARVRESRGQGQAGWAAADDA